MCVVPTYIYQADGERHDQQSNGPQGAYHARRPPGFPARRADQGLIERAAQLQRRKVNDYCLTAITKAARRTIAEHETIHLSECDRAAFFDALINPPEPSERLARAFAEHGRRVGA